MDNYFSPNYSQKLKNKFFGICIQTIYNIRMNETENKSLFNIVSIPNYDHYDKIIIQHYASIDVSHAIKRINKYYYHQVMTDGKYKHWITFFEKYGNYRNIEKLFLRACIFGNKIICRYLFEKICKNSIYWSNNKPYYLDDPVNSKPPPNIFLLRRKFLQENKFFTWRFILLPDLIETTCENGHLKILKWLSKFTTLKSRINKESEPIENMSHIIIKMYNGDDCKVYYEKKLSILVNTNYFELACKNGHLNVVKWLHRNCIFSDMNIEDIFKLVCNNNHIETAKWLLEQYNCLSTHYVSIFFYSCYHGHTEISQWIFDLVQQKNLTPINIHYDDEFLFRNCCRHARYEIIAWLLNFSINIHAHNDEAFRLCCEHGHLDMALLLFNRGLDTLSPINVNACHNYAFRKSCENGHLQIMNWLLQYPIDIHDYQDYAFRLACKNGHTGIVKRLIELGKQEKYRMVDIHCKNDYAFNWCYYNGYSEIMKELLRMDTAKKFLLYIGITIWYVHINFPNINIHHKYYFEFDQNLVMIRSTKEIEKISAIINKISIMVNGE